MKELKAVLDSKEYKKDLEDLSSYAASIKQERPILYILAKHLNERGFNVILEKKIGGRPYDLVVNNTKIEAKFYYESDLERRFKKEIDRAGGSIEPLIRELQSLKKRKKGTSWNMALAIVKDIIEKAPGIFMLIILSRDLTKIKEPKLLEQICWSQYETKYNKDYGHNNKRYLRLVNEFLDHVKKVKDFKTDYLKIDIDTMFPSSYHIYFCGFNAL